MELIRGLNNLRAAHRGHVVTIGNFDGVHRGHQALIRRSQELARELGCRALVLSFDPTPREFLSPTLAPARVYTLRDKLAALSDCGADTLVVLRFDHRLAALTAQDFIDEVLVRQLAVRALVVGDDFRFGRQRAGNFELLQASGARHGFAVEACEGVCVDGARCSSTRVRAALEAADFALAQRLLGRPYTVRGLVRGGLKLGRTLGMPTANMGFRRPIALRHGVYAVRARTADTEWPGVASLGVRPTLGLTRCLLETHVFGTPGSLYHRELTVEFHSFLRPQLRFDSLEALAERMQQDAEQARHALEARA